MQVRGLGLETDTVIEDGHAIFRIVKELRFESPTEASVAATSEDVARLSRFVAWLLGYGGSGPWASNGERAQALRHLFATVVLQSQSQNSSFETLLRSLGVDRQLDPRTPRKARARASETATRETGLSLERTDRTHRVQIRVSPQGAELKTETIDSTWNAEAWK